MTPIRFGILGGGRMARDFARAVIGTPDAELSAVWSRSETTLDKFVAEYPGTRAMSDLEELVESDAVDVIYVATPHHRHSSDSLKALRNNKPVVCEKPFATSSSEAEAVVAEARARQVFCMEAMWMRCIPAIRRAKELVDQGAIGEPRMLIADFGVATPYESSSRFFDPAMGGGALLDRGVYAVSLAHLFFGTPVSAVALSCEAPTGVDEQIGAVLRFGDGELAVVSAALGTTTTNAAVITGTDGRIHMEPPFYCTERLSIVSTKTSGSLLTAGPTTVGRALSAIKRSRIGSEMAHYATKMIRRPTTVRMPLAGNGYGYEVAEVVRCLRAGLNESPLITLDDTLAVMQTIDRLRQSEVTTTG